jgi:mRNA interferase YafQ
MYTIFPTKKFTKSLDKLTKNQKVKKDELYSVLKELSEKKQLAPKYKDHQLVGDMKDHRECHIHNDILLLYYYDDDRLVLVAVNIGTHSQIF